MDARTTSLFRLSYNYYLDPEKYRVDVDSYQIKGHEFVALLSALEHSQGHSETLNEIAESLQVDIEIIRVSAVSLVRQYLANTSHNFYQVLGLPDGAPVDLIREQYRRLISLFHPDKNTRDESIALSINEAYNVLKKPRRRLEYDKRINENQLSPATEVYTQTRRRPGRFGLNKKINRPLVEYLYFLPGFQEHSRIYVWSGVVMIAIVIAILPYQSGQVIKPPTFAYTPSTPANKDVPEKYTDGLSDVSVETPSVATLVNSPELDKLLRSSLSGEQRDRNQDHSVVEPDIVTGPKLAANPSIVVEETAAVHDPRKMAIAEKPYLEPQSPELEMVAPRVMADRLLTRSGHQPAEIAESVATDDTAAGEIAAAPVAEYLVVVSSPPQKDSEVQADAIEDAQATDAEGHAESKGPATIIRSVNYTSQEASRIQVVSYSEVQADGVDNQESRVIALPPEIIFMRYVSQYETGDISGISGTLPKQILAANGIGKAYIENAYRELFKNTSNRSIAINELTISQLGTSGNLLVSDIVLQVQFNNEPRPRRYEGVLTLRIINNLGGHEIAEINYDLN